MKVEMYEKVGEIIVAELRTAEENKEIAKKVNALREEERKRKEEEERQKDLKRLEEILPVIIEEINTSASLGGNTANFEWRKDVKTKITFYEWNIFCKYYKDYFMGLGYKFYTHEYSESWRKQSGKIGYASIYW